MPTFPSAIDEMSPYIDQAVRIAVLENQLQVERAAKEAAISSSQEVIKALTDVITANSNNRPSRDSSDLELEVKFLHMQLQKSERTNDLLMSRFQNSHLAKEYTRKVPRLTMGKYDAKDDKKSTSMSYNGESSNQQSIESPNQSSSESPIESPNCVECTSEHQVHKALLTPYAGNPDRSSLNSDITGTTVLPLTPRQKSTDVVLTREILEIDFLSLDDVLGVTDDDVVLHSKFSETVQGNTVNFQDDVPHDALAAEVPRGEDYESDIGFMMEQHAAPVLRDCQLDLSAPGVLNVGLDVSQLKKGGDYSIHQGRSRHRHTSRHRYRNAHSMGPGGNSSYDEREGAIRMNRHGAGIHDRKFPDFFKYGLRFTPEPSEKNTIRTILIDRLPSMITTQRLLDQLSGGDIFSASVCDTLKLEPMGFKSAVVVFCDVARTIAFVKYTDAHPLIFDSIPALVRFIPTYTYPISIPAQQRISEHGQTRCITITSFAGENDTDAVIAKRIKSLKEEIACDNGFRQANLAVVGLDNKGSLHLEFTSVSGAGSAYGILTGYRAFKNLRGRISFIPDPCARPLGDPLTPVELRTYPDFEEIMVCKGVDAEIKSVAEVNMAVIETVSATRSSIDSSMLAKSIIPGHVLDSTLKSESDEGSAAKVKVKDAAGSNPDTESNMELQIVAVPALIKALTRKFEGDESAANVEEKKESVMSDSMSETHSRPETETVIIPALIQDLTQEDRGRKESAMAAARTHKSSAFGLSSSRWADLQTDTAASPTKSQDMALIVADMAIESRVATKEVERSSTSNTSSNPPAIPEDTGASVISLKYNEVPITTGLKPKSVFIPPAFLSGSQDVTTKDIGMGMDSTAVTDAADESSSAQMANNPSNIPSNTSDTVIPLKYNEFPTPTRLRYKSIYVPAVFPANGQDPTSNNTGTATEPQAATEAPSDPPTSTTAPSSLSSPSSSNPNTTAPSRKLNEMPSVQRHKLKSVYTPTGFTAPKLLGRSWADEVEEEEEAAAAAAAEAAKAAMGVATGILIDFTSDLAAAEGFQLQLRLRGEGGGADTEAGEAESSPSKELFGLMSAPMAAACEV